MCLWLCVKQMLCKLHKIPAKLSEVGLLPQARPRLNPGRYVNGANVLNKGQTIMTRSRLNVAFCLSLACASLCSGQFLAGQKVNVDTYNNELYLEGSGSYQRILYEDAMNSTTTTKMIWSEIYMAPCGTYRQKPSNSLASCSLSCQRMLCRQPCTFLLRASAPHRLPCRP